MDHAHSTVEPTEPTFSPMTQAATSQTAHLITSLPARTTTERPTTHETETSTAKVSPRIKDSLSKQGLSKGVIITSSIVAVIGAVAIVLIALALVRFWKTRWKRRSNVRTVRSTTQLSFDNLSYTGEGRRDSVYQEVDMTDFEILRTRVVTSIKRKVSAFSSSGKEKDRDSRKISCGRLSIIETQFENTMDLGEIVQTHQV